MNRLSRKLRILLALLLGLAVFVIVFDWNWFRAPLERYYAEKSGRNVKVGHLDVALGWSLVPTVRLRDVHIPNAPWGSQRPFVNAREVSITFSIASLWEDRPKISRIVLADAEVSLERQADGLRNWRLRDPEYRGPGRTRVMVLETQRAQVTFVNRESNLELTAVASPLPPGEANDRFNTRIVFKGAYAGAPFAGEALNGGFLSFRESGVAFPIRGHLVSRKTRVELDGLLTDVFDLGPMDTAIRVTGPSLALLHPFVRVELPPSRAFDLRTHLVQRDDVYRFSKLSGKIGTTDLAGEAVFDRSRERHAIRARLTSASADVDDLRPLIGLRPGTEGDTPKQADGRAFPARPFNLEKLQRLDAQVTLDAAKLKSDDIPMLDSLRAEANLSAGVLQVKPLDLGLAGGHVTGSLSIDARREPPASQAVLELRGLRVERLVPALAQKTGSAGGLRGRIELAGGGASVASILASATGSIAARIEGGRMSNLADAKLGLNFGKMIGVLIKGERDAAIHCAAAAFVVANGLARSKSIVIDTEQTHVEGSGTLDLRRERVDLVLIPATRRPGLLTRSAAIRVSGALKDLRVDLEDRPPREGPVPSGCGARPG